MHNTFLSNHSFPFLVQRFTRAVLLTLALVFSLVPFVQAEPSSTSNTVNINVASAEQLAEVLDGVGLKKAKEIVDHRNRYGKFKHVDSLESVKGIGIATLEKNRSRIVIK